MFLIKYNVYYMCGVKKNKQIFLKTELAHAFSFEKVQNVFRIRTGNSRLKRKNEARFSKGRRFPWAKTPAQ